MGMVLSTKGSQFVVDSHTVAYALPYSLGKLGGRHLNMHCVGEQNQKNTAWKSAWA
jgi:hypothetical protein